MPVINKYSTIRRKYKLISDALSKVAQNFHPFDEIRFSRYFRVLKDKDIINDYSIISADKNRVEVRYKIDGRWYNQEFYRK